MDIVIVDTVNNTSNSFTTTTTTGTRELKHYLGKLDYDENLLH